MVFNEMFYNHINDGRHIIFSQIKNIKLLKYDVMKDMKYSLRDHNGNVKKEVARRRV